MLKSLFSDMILARTFCKVRVPQNVKSECHFLSRDDLEVPRFSMELLWLPT